MSPNPNNGITVVLEGGCKATLHSRGTPFNHWFEVEGSAGVRVQHSDTSETDFVFIDGYGRHSNEVLSCKQLHPTFDAHVKQQRLSPERIPALDKKYELNSKLKKREKGSISKNLVLMIKWKDHDLESIPPVEGYEILFNSKTKDERYAPTGSVQDFFLNQSYGALTIDSVLSGWIESSYTEEQVAGPLYTPTGEYKPCNGACAYANFTLQKAIMEAIEKFEKLIGPERFLEFDQDGDGTVDLFTVIHSGFGAENNGGSGVAAKWIWSHKYYLITDTDDESQYGYTAPQSGLKFMPYNINPGHWGMEKVPTPGITHIGVICHEMSHYFGLPDLYDTSYETFGIGDYGLMSNSWGKDGQQLYVPSLSAASKYLLGWLRDVVPLNKSATNLQLESYQETGKVYVIEFSEFEFVLLENRRPTGSDSLLEGGILIWHLDTQQLESRGNSVSLEKEKPWAWGQDHPAVRLIQADGFYELEKRRCSQPNCGNGGNRGDFFGYDSSAEISDTALPRPNLNSYQRLGHPSGLKLYGFSDPHSSTMQFSFQALSAGDDGETTDDEEIFQRPTSAVGKDTHPILLFLLAPLFLVQY